MPHDLMNKSYQLINHLARFKPGSTGYRMAALKWIRDNDPKSQAVLHSTHRLAAFVMSDDSKLLFDLTTGKFNVPR